MNARIQVDAAGLHAGVDVCGSICVHRAVNSELARSALPSQVDAGNAFGHKRVADDGIEQTQIEFTLRTRLPSWLAEVVECARNKQDVVRCAPGTCGESQ